MDGNKKINPIKLFTSFFLVGAFTFGGGIAMIPVIEREVVTKNKWLENDEFLDVIALAQSSPGPLAVNTSIYLGYKLASLPGAIFSALGTILPSFLIMLLVATVFTSIRSLKIVDSIFMGIRACVVSLLLSAIISITKRSKFKIPSYLIMLIVTLIVSLYGISPIFVILVGGFGYILYKLISLKFRRDENVR
ncbi:chromate transporter [Citroniella saccharovorans]|uniref:Chromate transporter n=1 Tax=Citroniella saccharovorans TaxID=2053367 RepID=A0AAW9MXT5_9FIRM|nr:chromate transporter [Citroniella saccharovorans]MEB3429390.1 chromate transporter [Citroniella saccharovorans]